MAGYRVTLFYLTFTLRDAAQGFEIELYEIWIAVGCAFFECAARGDLRFQREIRVPYQHAISVKQKTFQTQIQDA